MDKGLASAVCCTHGRMHVLPDAVRCFLDQDYPYKELIVINDHVGFPIDLEIPNDSIKIYNYDKRFPSLGAKRNAGKDLASGEYIFIWEDDDLSTPWRMSASIDALKENKYLDAVNGMWAINTVDNSDTGYSCNNFEGNTCFRAQFLKDHSYNEFKNIEMDLEMQSNGNILRYDTRPLFWYVYRWGLGVWHLSGCGTEESLDNWENGLLNSRTDLGTTIENRCLSAIWQTITNDLENMLDKKDFAIWKNKMISYL